MNNCSWYLYLCGRKVRNIRELRESFDTAALTGYFLGGSLRGFLSEIGENKILDRLSAIDTDGDIGRQLEFAFGVVPTKRDLTELTELAGEQPPEPAVMSIPAKKAAEAGIGSAVVYSGTAVSSFGAVSSFESYLPSILTEGVSSGYGIGSYRAFLTGQALASSYSGLLGSFTSGLLGSFTFGAFGVSGGIGTSSFYYGSFGSYSLSALFGYTTSFSSSSFSVGSYLSMFGLYGLLGKFGSFTGYGSYKGIFTGSFAWGTYTLGSYRFGLTGSFAGLGSFFNFGRLLSSGFMGNSGSSGSFGSTDRFFAENGSFRSSDTGITITAEEYHRTLINLSSCPLNAYGYGINLI